MDPEGLVVRLRVSHALSSASHLSAVTSQIYRSQLTAHSQHLTLRMGTRWVMLPSDLTDQCVHQGITKRSTSPCRALLSDHTPCYLGS